MINTEAMKPFGMAIKDYFNGAAEAEIKIIRDDGNESYIPASVFFRSSTDSPLDKIALDNCRGRVLDVGAGTGIHSLYLQAKGYSVCAIDVSPEACEIMKNLGVQEVHCASFDEFTAVSFDTLLILGRSIGIVETIAGLDGFLNDAHKLVKSDGQIILNSLDVSKTTESHHLSYHEANKNAGRYIGELRLHMEYKDNKGPVIGLLHVDPVTLAEHAIKAGWSCEILAQEIDGNYLTRLTRKD